MNKTISPLLIALFLCVGITVIGCTRTVYHRGTGPAVHAKKHGPPPHAPAHGYRHKHPDGVTLVYKTGINVYVVSGHTGVYFHKDHYYRQRDGRWHIGAHVGGPWTVVEVAKVPGGLRDKNHHPGKPKVKAKKKHLHKHKKH